MNYKKICITILSIIFFGTGLFFYHSIKSNGEIKKKDWEPITLKKQQSTMQTQEKETKSTEKENLPEKKEISGSSQEISIGVSLDLSREFKMESLAYKEGLLLAANKANQEGGINGKNLRLIILDDEYDPKKGRQNIEKFLNKYKTDILLSPSSIKVIEGYLDLIKEKKIVVIFPITGYDILRKPSFEYIIHLKPSYNESERFLIEYVIKHFGTKKFVFFVPQSTISSEIKKLIEKIGLKEEDYRIMYHNPYSTDFKKEADTIVAYNPGAIALFCTSRTAIELLRQIGNINLVGKKILGEELDTQSFKIFLKQQGLLENFFNTQSLPNPETSELEIAQEFRQAIKNKPIDNFVFEAYVGARVFIDILKKINGPITKESIIQTAKTLKNYNFKSLNLNFDPETRQLSNQIWLDKFGEKDWERISLKKKKTIVKPEDKENIFSEKEIKPKTTKKGYSSLR